MIPRLHIVVLTLALFACTKISSEARDPTGPKSPTLQFQMVKQWLVDGMTLSVGDIYPGKKYPRNVALSVAGIMVVVPFDYVVVIEQAGVAPRSFAEIEQEQRESKEAPRDGSSQMFRPIGSNMPSIEARRKNVEDGFIPLTRTELDRFLSGQPLSPMASTSEKNAWIMAEVMLGRRPAKDIPNEYRVVAKVNSRQAARGPATVATSRRASSEPFDPSMRVAPNTISAAPAAPRFVNTYDSAGNFHNGVVQPTGAYSGTVHSPMGEVGHVNGHVSPIGSFHGTDNHGGFYHGH